MEAEDKCKQCDQNNGSGSGLVGYAMWKSDIKLEI